MAQETRARKVGSRGHLEVLDRGLSAEAAVQNEVTEDGQTVRRLERRLSEP